MQQKDPDLWFKRRRMILIILVMMFLIQLVILGAYYFKEKQVILAFPMLVSLILNGLGIWHMTQLK